MYEAGRAAASNTHVTELTRLLCMYYLSTLYVKHERERDLKEQNRKSGFKVDLCQFYAYVQFSCKGSKLFIHE